MPVYPVPDHYETFVAFFVDKMSKAVDVSMLWGLLFLVINLSLDSKEGVSRIIGMLQEIDHKIEVLNGRSPPLTDYSVVKGDALEAHQEIMNLWLDVIMIFRNQSLEGTNQAAWETLNSMYKEALKNVEEAVARFDKVANFAQRLSQTVDLEMFRRVLSLKQNIPGKPVVPCYHLPVAKNTRFFGRQKVLQQIDNYLQPSAKTNEISSLAIYGLGGVGKTQVALAYAYEKLVEYDAIFWIPADTEAGLKQAFTNIAIESLKLSNARPQAHQENLVLVMSWLQMTSAKWLLILDDVEDHSIFDECWPVAQQSAILITTRHSNLATQPVGNGLEIPTFDVQEGAYFLEQLLAKRNVTEAEHEASLQVSSKLGGHALAINQMAALINARGISTTTFLSLYRKNSLKMHRERKRGWKYIGYQHAIDTVWRSSFASLDKYASLCLGVLSWLEPDSIPYALFKKSETVELPDTLKFCKDDYRLGGAIEQLLDSVLVKLNASDRSISLHQLVQAECLSQADFLQWQGGFEAATTLLLQVFPHYNLGRIIDSDRPRAELYIRHVLSLIFNFSVGKGGGKALKPSPNLLNLINDCSWYLYHSFGINSIRKVLEIGVAAHHHCPDTSDYMLPCATLFNIASFYELECRGNFRAAERQIRSCLSIRLKHLVEEDEAICAAYDTLGLVSASRLRFEEALTWFKKADNLAKIHSKKWPMKALQFDIDISRVHYSVGEYTEARRRLESALDDASRCNSTFWAVRAHLAYASLHIETGELDSGRECCELAWKLLGEENQQDPSLITGRYFYKIGYIALKQGQIDEAIEHFKQTLVICKSCHCSTGLLARATYALSEALLSTETGHEEGLRRQSEARRLRKQALEDFFDQASCHEDASFEDYDSLVSITER